MNERDQLAALVGEVGEMKATVEILIKGLSELPPVLGHHGEMLAEILSAVADREDDGEESPLLAALNEIIGLGARHARSLDRIEDRLLALKGIEDRLTHIEKAVG